jgi:hypothetical protein
MKNLKKLLKARSQTTSGKIMLTVTGIILLVATPFLFASFVIGGLFKVAGIIAFGTDIVDRWKKQGFRVDAHNHYGSYSRMLKKPKNPKTDKQKQQRGLLSSLSKMWAEFTVDRLGWNEFAKTLPKKNRAGHLIYWTGEALFVSWNTIVSILGGTPNTDVPPVKPFPIMIDLELLANYTGTPAISIEYALPGWSADVDCRVMIEATGAVSPGIFYGHNYKYLGDLEAQNLTVQDITTMWEAIYGLLTAGMVGKKIFVRVKLAFKSNGEAQGYTPASALVS